MIKKKYFLLCLMFLLFPSLQAYADNKYSDRQSGEPMIITSDSMEAYKNDKIVVFSGNANVRQGKSTLRSDKLILHYREPDQRRERSAVHQEKAGNLEKIEAKGNVRLNHDQRIVTGDEATYLQDNNQIIMTGNAILREGKNFIKGDKVIFFLSENRGIVQGNQNKVQAVIYPRDMKKTETK